MLFRSTLFFRNEKKKIKISKSKVKNEIKKALEEIQKSLLKASENRLKNAIKKAVTIKEVEKIGDNGGIAEVYWCGNGECYDNMKLKEGLEMFGSSIEKNPKGKCITCKKETSNKAYIANTY